MYTFSINSRKLLNWNDLTCQLLSLYTCHHCYIWCQLSENMDGHRDRGINMQGAASFNNKLVTKLSCAPADIMVFLEACAMGNIDRVNELIEKGVVS